jgi:hypothetical protein
MCSTGSKMAGKNANQASAAGLAGKAGAKAPAARAVRAVTMGAAPVVVAATGGDPEDPAMIQFIYREGRR